MAASSAGKAAMADDSQRRMPARTTMRRPPKWTTSYTPCMFWSVQVSDQVGVQPTWPAVMRSRMARKEEWGEWTLPPT